MDKLMNLMSDIKYGWIDKNGNKHYDVDDDFSTNYSLQSPEEILVNKVGVCWDQVELERYYLENNNVYVQSYFIVYYDEDKCPTHTFLTYEKDGYFYWFEHAWVLFSGIHRYNNLQELLLDVKNKFIKYELNNNYDYDNLIIYNYNKPKSHINVQEFYKHCESGKIIYLDVK